MFVECMVDTVALLTQARRFLSRHPDRLEILWNNDSGFG
jgi:hypothetical protein